jgi:hypothetical protein
LALQDRGGNLKSKSIQFDQRRGKAESEMALFFLFITNVNLQSLLFVRPNDL